MDPQEFTAEQKHLDTIYKELIALRDELTHEIEVEHKNAAQDLRDLSEEVRIDFGGADETIETLAAIETLNSVIDTYNQHHDFAVEKLGRIILLLGQPYFAKVRLKLRPGRPSRDVYIGVAGMTNKDKIPLIVDWRNPIAQTYYNQEMGTTSYEVDGKTRTVELELRRQFEIKRNKLIGYFDTSVAIEDSLLLAALKRHHTQKLTAITATIQKEQNQVVRHKDCDVLLVSGIAGSGKTSVLLQRVAYLFYQYRESLVPEQLILFTPNTLFSHYIDAVLPTLGEKNPPTYTWKSFLKSQGISHRSSGAHQNIDSLSILKNRLSDYSLTQNDLTEISWEGRVYLKKSQIFAAIQKFAQFSLSPRLIALTKDDLQLRLDKKLAQMAHDEEQQEKVLELDLEKQMEIFGEVVAPSNDEELTAFTKRYLKHQAAPVYDQIDALCWLNFDHIAQELSPGTAISGADLLYLRLLITGRGDTKARFVLIDEVQDYTPVQLKVLARYFAHAHFLLLGDPNQAIYADSASFKEMSSIFSATHPEQEACQLTTSYRSTPQITQLFAGLLPKDAAIQITSVHREGELPRFIEVRDGTQNPQDYLAQLTQEIERMAKHKGLCAVIVQDIVRAKWLAKQLGDIVMHLEDSSEMPTSGCVLVTLALAKGLEFDSVVIADAQREVYDASDLSRRRLYTAISRAMHRVSLVSQGAMTPLVDFARAEDTESTEGTEGTESTKAVVL